MGSAIFGGIIIGLSVKGWLGIFILPVAVAFYQCVSLYFLVKQKRINISQIKGFTNPYAEFHYNLDASAWTKWVDWVKIYLIQFLGTYTRTILVALVIVLIKYLVGFEFYLMNG